MTDREEFERRLLALVRDYMDGADEQFPDGYEIEDFIVLYQLRVAPAADAPLRAWDGGRRPGWWLHAACSSTHQSWWVDEAMLNEALSHVRDARFDERHGANDHADDSDPPSD